MAEVVVEWIGSALLNAGFEELGVALIFEASAIVTAGQIVAVAACCYSVPEHRRMEVRPLGRSAS